MQSRRKWKHMHQDFVVFYSFALRRRYLGCLHFPSRSSRTSVILLHKETHIGRHANPGDVRRLVKVLVR
ncbi:hypothetical protein SOVF_200320 isoform C [Spinacia oleracea]|nr:hypothetical protein SOVF_200320 isoform C [Spinacia oleracea]